jgi:hypothetical protein
MPMEAIKSLHLLRTLARLTDSFGVVPDQRTRQCYQMFSLWTPNRWLQQETAIQARRKRHWQKPPSDALRLAIWACQVDEIIDTARIRMSVLIRDDWGPVLDQMEHSLQRLEDKAPEMPHMET